MSESQTYTSVERLGGPAGTGGIFGAPGSVESAVKSLVDAFKDRREQRLEQLRNPPEEPDAGLLCWGRAPALAGSATNPTGGVSVKNRKSTEEPLPPESGNKIIRLTEQRRYVEEIKVASEEDSETFVIVDRGRAYVFSGSDGYTYEMALTPKGPRFVLKEGAALPKRL